MDQDALEIARLTENLNLQRALLRRLQHLHESVRLVENTKVVGIDAGELSGGWPIVTLSSGEALRARLLVRLYIDVILSIMIHL
jgi:ubiquinone biosynthesis monooxygenase Coq6